MKLKFIDDLTFDIYVNKEFNKDINVENKSEIEELLKKLLKKIKYRYRVDIEGFYNVNVYIDKFYGIIFNLKKEELNYYEYFNGQIDINLKIIKSNFLYKLDDIPTNLLSKINRKTISNDIFFEVREELNIKEKMYLVEHTEKILKI